MTTMAAYVLTGAGILFLCYFILICVHCGYAPDFSWFWSVGGILMLFLGRITHILSDWAGVITFLFLAGFFAFGFSFWILAKQGNSKAKPGAEYVIVLGAKVNGTVPSLALQERINKACEYLKENEYTKAVLTGGRGRGEDISEASVMERELILKGIEKERLYLEDQSTTTLENIWFTEGFVKNKEAAIVIITSDFHTMRGRRIALDAGFQNVETIGAKSSAVMRLHYYTRETLSWMKYFSGWIRRRVG